jgi:uncharacterized Zn finger protein (UPF0148 family)
MLDELMREIGRNRTQRVSVSVQIDDDGYYDRECPSPECRFQFKVLFEDWKEKVRDEEAFCPFCGHAAAGTEWNTEEQLDHLKAVAVAHMQRQIGGALRGDAERWNQRQPKSAFVSMTMSVSSRPVQVPVPPETTEPMRLRVTCSACGCRFAGLGAAFFCPACGHTAVEEMFTQALSGIKKTLGSLPLIRTAIGDADTAEATVRLVIENGLQNVVTAFQRYAEALYARFQGLPAPRRNAFQNLNEGSILWKSATGKDYAAFLEPSELLILKRYFQQRHLLAHQQGLVDQDYVDRTRDTSYRVGQHLVVKESGVKDCIKLIEKLTSGMAA